MIIKNAQDLYDSKISYDYSFLLLFFSKDKINEIYVNIIKNLDMEIGEDFIWCIKSNKYFNNIIGTEENNKPNKSLSFIDFIKFTIENWMKEFNNLVVQDEEYEEYLNNKNNIINKNNMCFNLNSNKSKKKYKDTDIRQNDVIMKNSEYEVYPDNDK